MGQFDTVLVEQTKWRKRGELQSRRRARRGGTLNLHRRRKNGGKNFEPVHDWNHGQIESRSSNRGTRCRTKLTGMRTARRRIHIGTKVELRRQEDDSEQQSTDTRPLRVSEHLSTKTKLRPEWLRGQATDRGLGNLFASRATVCASKVLG